MGTVSGLSGVKNDFDTQLPDDDNVTVAPLQTIALGAACRLLIKWCWLPLLPIPASTERLFYVFYKLALSRGLRATFYVV